MGIIAAILLPALIVVGLIVAVVRQRMEAKSDASGKSSWRFSPKPRTASPLSDSTDSLSSAKKRRKYDAVYRTHEPLPGKPDIEFEDKEWDLSLKEPADVSPASTSSGRKAPLAVAAPVPPPLPQITKQSDV